MSLYQDNSPGSTSSEFYWARQRAKRALLFWVVAVLTLTGLVAAAAWTVGSNIGRTDLVADTHAIPAD